MTSKNPAFLNLFRMFLGFLKIGAFTIGGGYAMLPLMEKEFVDRKGWVSRSEILDIFAAAQSVPGVIAINSSLFIGYKVGGIAGALAAALGMILPSFTIILGLSFALASIRDNAYAAKAFAGVRAGVAALITLTAFRFGKATLKTWAGRILALLSFGVILLLNINSIYAILAGGAFGVVAYGFNWPGRKK